MKKLVLSLAVVAMVACGAYAETYAEKLGWPKDAKVLMIHADDAGMSHASNAGTIATLEAGTVTSASIMMPCSWVPEFLDYLKANPDVDAGVHITLTSEWKPYRWSPVAGRSVVPGLVDEMGYMHSNGGGITSNATADEVEAEIRAQIDLAEKMGVKVTHIDSHMGTCYAKPEYFLRYVKVAIEKQLPLLVAGAGASGDDSEAARMLRPYLQQIWDAGLPVLDYIDTASYGWKTQDKAPLFVEMVRNLKPGVTWFNVHPTTPTEESKAATRNREHLFGDYLGLVDPAVKKAIEEEGVILTTWRELKQRRDAVK